MQGENENGVCMYCIDIRHSKTYIVMAFFTKSIYILTLNGFQQIFLHDLHTAPRSSFPHNTLGPSCLSPLLQIFTKVYIRNLFSQNVVYNFNQKSLH